MGVNVYRYDDASAPVLMGQTGSLTDLLNACLVTGYGAKAGAGWTRPYSDTGKAVFRQGGDYGYYLRAVDTDYQTNFYGHDSVSDVNTGTNQFPTAAQLICCARSSWTIDTTPRPWILVANERGFILQIPYNSTTGVGLTAADAYNNFIYFGDIASYLPYDAHAVMLIGSSSISASYCGSVYYGSTIDSHYIARSVDQMTISQNIGKTVDAHGMQHNGTRVPMGAYGAAYPDPVFGGLMMSRVYAKYSTGLRGYIPGLWAPCHNKPLTPGDTFSGNAADPVVSGKTFIMLTANSNGTQARIAVETSDTWEL